MKYCIYGIESFTHHTQKFNVLRPDLEAKVKAAHRRGQGQGQGHKILSSRSRPVLEDPIPVSLQQAAVSDRVSYAWRR